MSKTYAKKFSKKRKELTYEIKYSDEPCTKEESIQAMTKLCKILFEMDRDQHKKQLEENEQYCAYCGKKITELYDFFSPDGQNACFECAKKVVANPNRQKTFCGIPVRE